MVGRRGKMNVQYIMDRAKRNRTLAKRLPNVFKKAREFAVLCDAPTGLVMYLPGQEQPVTWPSPDVAADVLREYKEAGDSHRFKLELDNPEFMGTLVEKEQAKLSALQRESKDQDSNLLVADFLAGRRGRFHDLSPEAFAALERKAEETRRDVKERLQELRRGAVLPPPPAQLELVPFAQAPPKEMVQPAPLMMASPNEMVQPAPLMMAPPKEMVQAAPLMMAPPFSPYLYSTPLLQAGDQYPLALDGFGLPTSEELQAILEKAGIFTSPQPNPFHDDAM
ncbi:unnamed protein product [Alopecurus aequalis]